MEEKVFLVKDLSGRGYSCEYKLSELHELDEEHETPEDETIVDWGEFAEIGDEYTEINSIRITRIK